ncbi:Dfp1/Him1, central region-domain-containing protein [Irpex rosettiformis]|uniref:Dfp1/Him1, central region-domain-containing protein n=1 Tax=Irpex rosettiformis TaxID=378272 RepID=A0ACB8U0R5_9APHY|nr:Dfp1/Him1, central region-domain-containing protein [Irpex rosettiformis]
MSTLSRNPLASRSVSNHVPASSSAWKDNTGRFSSAKRTRSPEPNDTLSAKRSKAFVDGPRSTIVARDEARKREVKEPKETKDERERKRLEREEDFRVKYSRAFPSWVFYFDLDALESDTPSIRKELEKLVLHMGARVEDFFSKDVTHLIVTRLDEDPVNKENHKSRTKEDSASVLKSPVKLRQTTVDTPGPELVKKANSFGMKIWPVDKLKSVIDRCAPSTLVASTSTSLIARSGQPTRERSLTRLLESERLHGTSERDPTQKRHDFIYFPKNSYFVLVEDIRQELQTIVALEYPIMKSRDGKEKGSWPVLYCDHRTRNPFFPYDEKEERRIEKAERAEHEREQELARRKAKLREQERRRRAQQEALKKGDLRRTVSMQNIRRRASQGEEFAEDYIDLEIEGDPDSVAASGYLASGNYVAASGNSVGITSTTGTTSTAGLSLRSLHLPRNIAGKLNKEIVTSRRLSQITPTVGKENAMGPPLTIPDRPQRMLRKSRSTNTMRLPKRDEGSKPGYCESCRVKFEDFHQHIVSKRHKKFAENDANFANLDHVLSRVRRRTLEEVRAERSDCGLSPEDDAEGEDIDEDSTMVPFHVADAISREEWMKA